MFNKLANTLVRRVHSVEFTGEAVAHICDRGPKARILSGEHLRQLSPKAPCEAGHHIRNIGGDVLAVLGMVCILVAFVVLGIMSNIANSVVPGSTAWTEAGCFSEVDRR